MYRLIVTAITLVVMLLASIAVGSPAPLSAAPAAFQAGATATPTSSPPGPGMFVTNLRLSPERPAYNQNISFMPTFSNTTNTVQTFTWKVYIWRADSITHTDNETSALTTIFPVGSGEYQALGTYRYGPTGSVCDYFFARVAWLDANNKPTYFTTPDGKVYEKGFAICDVNTIPTSVPPTPAPSPVPPKPGPGLFVTNLRLSPEQPGYNQNISFMPTFSNTTSTVQTFTWKVYIWRADSITHTDNETSALTTGFPVGSGEYQALGTYRYGPTGYLCNYFFARVAWLDANNLPVYFTTPDGIVYEKGFKICDVNSLSTPVPPKPGSGTFVTNLRLSPERPAYNQNISFIPTFSNTTATVQNFTWKVYIWRADTVTHRDNETSAMASSFPVGSVDYQALGTYRYGPTGYQCDYFFARVAWLDVNNLPVYFTTPDGKVYEKGFAICDVNTIPTLAPPAPAPSPVPPAPGPGLFVTNIRLQPFETPQHNMDISFFPTFQNTSNVVQTFKWKVYIWRADTITKTDNETSLLTTGFPVGTGEYQTLGTYRYGPTGYQCDYFYARVGWLDANNKVTYFPMPNGQVYEKGFKICN